MFWKFWKFTLDEMTEAKDILYDLVDLGDSPIRNNSKARNTAEAHTPTFLVRCVNKQFTNTVNHSTHKANRSIDKAGHKLPKHTT